MQEGLEVQGTEEISTGVSQSSKKESPRTLLALAATLERLVLRNEKCLKDLSEHRKMTIFHGLRPPNISILKYLERIHKYSNCSPSCFVVGFIFIDHLVHKQPDVPLISLMHRLLITSIMVATKLLDDVHYNNAFYARVGGMTNAELNSLGIDFLFRLDFQLQVTSNVFVEGYCTHLEREMMLAEQQIERTPPNTVNVPSEHQNHEKQRMLEDAHRKLRLVMNPSSASAKSMEALVSPTTSLPDP